MLSALRRLTGLGRAWKPLDFPNHFPKIPLSQQIEEETIPGYLASRYYPVRIGQVLRDRYQIVGKLGFGTSSTVWLARDLSHRRHVALKLFINAKSMGEEVNHEINIYKHIGAAYRKHPGYDAVRSLIDSFDVDGPEGKHQCLVHIPLWESVLTFLRRNPVGRLPVPIVAFMLERLFSALDFLHTECKVIHTDIKADNIMFGIEDDTVFTDFEQQELREPSPRKETDGRTIYLSRGLRLPKEVGAPVLCDFGSAVFGDVEHTEDVQPNVYRAPEVILDIPWTYKIDIWNVGCMIWDVFEGGHLFTGQDPEHQTYRGRAHLAEIISLLGPPPPELLARARLTHKFFSDDGTFSGGIPVPNRVPLEDRETTLEGQSKDRFLQLMRKMLQWESSRRSSAKGLLEDDWILENTKR